SIAELVSGDDFGSCRVVVVDDDPIVASGTAAILEGLGHIPTEANSGAAALRLLQSGADIDLVITDHAMPGMNGTELASRIRLEWPDLPIVIAPGYPDAPNDLGLPRLLKPYREPELAALVSRLVRRPRAPGQRQQRDDKPRAAAVRRADRRADADRLALTL